MSSADAFYLYGRRCSIRKCMGDAPFVCIPFGWCIDLGSSDELTVEGHALLKLRGLSSHGCPVASLSGASANAFSWYYHIIFRDPNGATVQYSRYCCMIEHSIPAAGTTRKITR